MADEIDTANALAQAERERAMRVVMALAAAINPGKPGDCDFCGEWSGRLVGGACAPCRDKLRLP